MIKVMKRKDYLCIYKESHIFFEDVDVATNQFKQLIDMYTGESKFLSDILNQINNQGIEYIDIQKYLYKVNGKELAFERLSRGERIFLVVAVAIHENTDIYLGECVTALTDKTLILLNKIVSEYWHSSEVIIIPAEDCLYFEEVLNA